MYSSPNFEPVHCSMFGSNCCFLTRIQVSQETGKLACYSHLFKNFPQFIMITVNGLSIVSEEELDVFLELPYFLRDPTNVGNLISGSSDFLKPSLYIWKFLVQYCQSLAWRILRITLLAAGISLVAQMIENLTAMQETWVLVPGSGRSLGEGEWLLTPVFLPGEIHK